MLVKEAISTDVPIVQTECILIRSFFMMYFIDEEEGLFTLITCAKHLWNSELLDFGFCLFLEGRGDGEILQLT